MAQFKWQEIPKNRVGYVDYQSIPSPMVRRLVGEAEKVKLKEEYKARIKWTLTAANVTAIRKIEYQLQSIENMLCDLSQAAPD